MWETSISFLPKLTDAVRKCLAPMSCIYARFSVHPREIAERFAFCVRMRARMCAQPSQRQWNSRLRNSSRLLATTAPITSRGIRQKAVGCRKSSVMISGRPVLEGGEVNLDRPNVSLHSIEATTLLIAHYQPGFPAARASSKCD
jgi:hypothetical protein